VDKKGRWGRAANLLRCSDPRLEVAEMKRVVVVLVAMGLLAGALVAPADAKKKKKKPPPAATLVPGELKYFLHYPADGATPEGCTAATHMDLKDSPGDTGCSYTFQAAQEAFSAAGQELLAYSFPATEGTPFILDASRKLTGEITLRGTVSLNTNAEITLSGTVGGNSVTLAEGETAAGNGALSNSAQGQNLPGPAVTVPVDLDIDKALDKLEVTTLMLTVTIRGVHRGGIDYERTPSHIVLPIFQKS
jgi:hypothetical protein